MKQYALVIGIGQYTNLTELSKSVNDARAVAEVLRKHGKFEQVRLLCDTKAKTELELFNQANQVINERVVIMEYFS